MSALVMWNIVAFVSVALLLSAKVRLRLWHDSDQRSRFFLVVSLLLITCIGGATRLGWLNEENKGPFLIGFYALLASSALYRFSVHVAEHRLSKDLDNGLPGALAGKCTHDHDVHEHDIDPESATKVWVGLMTLLTDIETAEPCDTPKCVYFRARLKAEAEALRSVAVH